MALVDSLSKFILLKETDKVSPTADNILRINCVEDTIKDLAN